MMLTPGLSSAVDLFHKLQRDICRLDSKVTCDCFFDLVITGYSLIDWVKHDTSLPPEARTPAAITSLYQDSWLKVCGDLATASKHFKLSQRLPVVTAATSKTGYGVGRYGIGAYGEGEEDIEVQIDNGSSWNAREFAVGVVQAWINFFARHKISV